MMKACTTILFLTVLLNSPAFAGAIPEKDKCIKYVGQEEILANKNAVLLDACLARCPDTPSSEDSMSECQQQCFEASKPTRLQLDNWSLVNNCVAYYGEQILFE